MRMLSRWRKWMGTATLVAGAAGLGGCTRPLYMTPETQQLVSTVGLPPDLATNPAAAAVSDYSDQKAPATVLDANREPRFMTLQEAIAIALERGTRGNGSAFLFQNFNLSGGNALQGGFSASYNDDLVQFAGRGVQGDDSIRAFALDPAIVAADIEGALSKFDARFTGSMSWQKRDQAVANIFNNFNNGDFAAFSAGLIKPLPTGGVANITVDTNYSRLGAVPQGFAVINPSYTPSLTVGIEQPLGVALEVLDDLLEDRRHDAGEVRLLERSPKARQESFVEGLKGEFGEVLAVERGHEGLAVVPHLDAEGSEA
jgi:hypothetical protein